MRRHASHEERTKAARRERKRRIRMKVSGKNVFTLRSIVIKKGQRAKRKQR